MELTARRNCLIWQGGAKTCREQYLIYQTYSTASTPISTLMASLYALLQLRAAGKNDPNTLKTGPFLHCFLRSKTTSIWKPLAGCDPMALEVVFQVTI
jgi:hypothetical protein